MCARSPYAFDILVVVVVAHSLWSWWCCRQAKLAYKGVDHLFEWGKDIAALLKVVGDCSGCGDADPTWPPKDPGDFPGDFR